MHKDTVSDVEFSTWMRLRLEGYPVPPDLNERVLRSMAPYLDITYEVVIL